MRPRQFNVVATVMLPNLNDMDVHLIFDLHIMVDPVDGPAIYQKVVADAAQRILTKMLVNHELLNTAIFEYEDGKLIPVV